MFSNLVVFECCYERIEVYFRLWSFFESLKIFFHVVHPIGFSVMFSSSPYFASNSFASFSFHCWYAFVYFPPTGRIFFRCFWIFCFVRIFLSYLAIFLTFLLSPEISDLSPLVVSFVLTVLLCFFRPNIFSRFSSVVTFLLIVVDFLSVFPV